MNKEWLSAVEDRFWRNVDASGDCWEWTRSLVDGYGRIAATVDGVLERHLAHRVVWELLVGPIPDDYEVDHRCYRRHCVNPDHLEPVPGVVNTERRRVDNGGFWFSAQTHCKRGHEFTPENTYRPPGRTSGRWCRQCKKVRKVTS